MAINWISLSDEELINRVRTVYPAGTLIAELAARLCVALAEIAALETELDGMEMPFMATIADEVES